MWAHLFILLWESNIDITRIGWAGLAGGWSAGLAGCWLGRLGWLGWGLGRPGRLGWAG